MAILVEMQEYISFDPCIRAINIKPIVVPSGDDIIYEMHDRPASLATGEINHVIVVGCVPKKILQEDAVPVATHAPRTVTQLEAVGELVGRQHPRLRPVQVEHAEADGAQPQREDEDRPGARRHSLAGERRPAGRGAVEQLCLQHRYAFVERPEAGPLAQGVLDLLDQRADLVGATQ